MKTLELQTHTCHLIMGQTEGEWPFSGVLTCVFTREQRDKNQGVFLF